MSLWRKQFPFIWIKNVWDWNDLLDASIALWPQFPSRRRLLRQRQASGRWPTTRTTLPAVSGASICSQTSRPFWRLPPTHPPLRCLAASHPTSCARGARMEDMPAAKHYLLFSSSSLFSIEYTTCDDGEVWHTACQPANSLSTRHFLVRSADILFICLNGHFVVVFSLLAFALSIE